MQQQIKDRSVLAYVVVPIGVDREEYVKSCYVKESFSVRTDSGLFISDVSCSKHCIDDIEIPIDCTTLGSCVMLTYFEKYSTYLIIAVFNNLGVSDFRTEGSLEKRKNKFGSVFGFVAEGLKATFRIFMKTIKTRAAKLYLEAIGNEESEINLSSSGWVLMNTNKGFVLRSKNDKTIRLDENEISFYNSENQSLTIKDKELIYTDGTNNLKIDKNGYNLGNINFQQYIQKILDFLSNTITLNSPCGPCQPGCLSTTAGPTLNNLITELKNINKKN